MWAVCEDSPHFYFLLILLIYFTSTSFPSTSFPHIVIPNKKVIYQKIYHFTSCVCRYYIVINLLITNRLVYITVLKGLWTKNNCIKICIYDKTYATVYCLCVLVDCYVYITPRTDCQIVEVSVNKFLC